MMTSMEEFLILTGSGPPERKKWGMSNGIKFMTKFPEKRLGKPEFAPSG